MIDRRRFSRRPYMNTFTISLWKTLRIILRQIKDQNEKTPGIKHKHNHVGVRIGQMDKQRRSESIQNRRSGQSF